MISLMEVARVNACVGALVGGAAVGVGVEPHAEAIITSVISIIEIGDAVILFAFLWNFNWCCAQHIGVVVRPPDQSALIFVQMVVTSVYQKPSEEHKEFAKMSLIWYTKS